MSEEEFKTLGEKVKSGGASLKEMLTFLQELNGAMEETKQILQSAKN